MGGSITRLGVVFDDPSGASQFPAAGFSLSLIGGVPYSGGKREDQVWYRDAATYCTSTKYNLTNALEVTWSW